MTAARKNFNAYEDAKEQQELWRGYPLFRKIPKHAVRQMSVFEFHGPVFLLRTGDEAREAVRTLKQESVLGFDTETQPDFRGKKNPVALVQLATRHAAYIFQLSANQFQVFPELAELLSNPMIKKVGVAIEQDMKDLGKATHFVPKGLVDLQLLATQCGLKECGLQGLTALLLGHNLVKTEQLSQWDQDELRPPQLAYAACDAVVALRLLDCFSFHGSEQLRAKHEVCKRERKRRLLEAMAVFGPPDDVNGVIYEAKRAAAKNDCKDIRSDESVDDTAAAALDNLTL